MLAGLQTYLSIIKGFNCGEGLAYCFWQLRTISVRGAERDQKNISGLSASRLANQNIKRLVGGGWWWSRRPGKFLNY